VRKDACLRACMCASVLLSLVAHARARTPKKQRRRKEVHFLQQHNNDNIKTRMLL
jgi:hypothetical protein